MDADSNHSLGYSSRLEWLSYLLLAIAILLYFYGATFRSPTHEGYGFDGRFYAAQSEWFRGSLAPEKTAFAFHPPWSYRILTPLLASLLPLSTLDAFTLLNALIQLGCILLLALLLRSVGISQLGTCLGILLYGGVFWSVRWAFYMPCYADSLTQFFSIAILVLTLRRQYGLLPVVFCLAAFQKESVLLLAPFCALHFSKECDPRWKRDAQFFLLKLIIPTLTVIGALRVLVPAGFGKYAPEAMLLHITSTYLLSPENYLPLLLTFLAGLGILPVLAISVLPKLVRLAREEYSWLAYFAAGTVALFGGWDGGRMLLFVLPGLITLVVREFDRNRFTLASLALAIPFHALLGQAYDFHRQSIYYRDIMWPLTTSKPEIFQTQVLIALSGCVGIFLMAWLWERRSR